VTSCGITKSSEREADRGEIVRRQGYWDTERFKMRESLARQAYDVMRLAVGAASGDLQLSVV
jgi:hypothetical protein